MSGGSQPVSDNLEARLLAYRPLIERHVRAVVRDRADPEELTQDTYARALQRVDELRDPQAALAWLHRIATNVCLDRLRRRQPSLVSLDVELAASEEPDGNGGAEPEASEILSAVERSEMSECVQKYLETLPDDYRTVVFLHDVYELSNPEIAELLDCSVATAKIRLHRGRVRLRAILNQACTFEIDERGVMVCDPVAAATCHGSGSSCGCETSREPQANE